MKHPPSVRRWSQWRKPLDADQRAQAASDCLRWAEDCAVNLYGLAGKEYAGEALWHALVSFSGQCPLTAWIIRVIRFDVRDRIRQWRGRSGTARHQAHVGRVSLLDHDREAGGDCWGLHQVGADELAAVLQAAAPRTVGLIAGLKLKTIRGLGA